VSFKFHSVGEQWQRNACVTVGVVYEKPNGVHVGGSNVALTPPDINHIKGVLPDGNCMFRSLSYVVTGSQEHHYAVRSKIAQHMNNSVQLRPG